MMADVLNFFIGVRLFLQVKMYTKDSQTAGFVN